jgi:hypothetical protein
MQRTVHSQRLAGFLMFKGHRLMRMEKDAGKPQFNVFVFNASEQLESDITEYVQK